MSTIKLVFIVELSKPDYRPYNTENKKTNTITSARHNIWGLSCNFWVIGLKTLFAM